MNGETIEQITNTGSIAYQIISLRKEIEELKLHLIKNKTPKKSRGNDKDIPAKRALLKKVAKMRGFLKYLEKNDYPLYEKIKQDSKKVRTQKNKNKGG